MKHKTLKIAILVFCFLVLSFSVNIKAKSGDVASWYGGGEKLNKHTANGEVFDPNEFTCASWYYSFGTRLKVTNIGNGRSVVVRVNDRGPNKRLKRAIDLSKRAFSNIADLKTGLISVKIEKVS